MDLSFHKEALINRAPRVQLLIVRGITYILAFCCLGASRTTCKFLHPLSQRIYIIIIYTQWYRSDLMGLHFDSGASWQLLKLPLEMFLSVHVFSRTKVFSVFSLHHFPFDEFASPDVGVLFTAKCRLPWEVSLIIAISSSQVLRCQARQAKMKLATITESKAWTVQVRPRDPRNHRDVGEDGMRSTESPKSKDVSWNCIVGLLEPQQLSDQTSIWINVPKSDTPEKWTV